MNPPETTQDNRPGGHPDRRLACQEIQELMLDYMEHELGTGRSDVIREHTRHCATCRERLAELQNTLGLLNAAFPRGGAPQQLSKQHHARLVRALMHPVLDWIYIHHFLVSALVTALVIAGLVLGLRQFRAWQERITDPGIPVIIGEEPEGGEVGEVITDH